MTGESATGEVGSSRGGTAAHRVGRRKRGHGSPADDGVAAGFSSAVGGAAAAAAATAAVAPPAAADGDTPSGREGVVTSDAHDDAASESLTRSSDRPVASTGSESSIQDMPQSTILSRPRPSSSRFSGLMSR